MDTRACHVLLLLLLPLAAVARADAVEDRAKLAARLIGMPADLVKCHAKDADLVDVLFQSTLKRAAREAERQSATDHLTKATKRELACQDLVWAVMNTKEFMQLHGLTFEEVLDLSNKVQAGWKK